MMAAPIVPAQVAAVTTQFTNGQHPADVVLAGQYQPTQVQPTFVASVPQATQSHLEKAEKAYTKHLVDSVLGPIAAYSASRPGVLTVDVMLQILALPAPVKAKPAIAAPGEVRCAYVCSRAPNVGKQCERKPVNGAQYCSQHNKSGKATKVVPNIGPGLVSTGVSAVNPFVVRPQGTLVAPYVNGNSAVPPFVPAQITTINPIAAVHSVAPIQQVHPVAPIQPVQTVTPVVQQPQPAAVSLEAQAVDGQPGVFQETSRGLRFRYTSDEMAQVFGKVNRLGQAEPLSDDDRAFVNMHGMLLAEEPVAAAVPVQAQPVAVIPGPAPPMMQIGGMTATPVINRLG